MQILNIALYIATVLMCLPTGIAVLKGPVEMVNQFIPGALSESDLASPFLKHCLYIDMGKNIFLCLLLLWTSLKANLETKKVVAVLNIVQFLFALFVAHGFASPLHMSKPYFERVTSDPAILVICGGQIIGLTLGLLTAGEEKGKKKKR